MLRALIFVLALFLALPVLAASREVTLDDGRSYRVDLPDHESGAPMILALHGGGGNPNQMARNSGLSLPANAQGYAVIYPSGNARGAIGLRTWNAGSCCAYARERQIDDVAYLDAVIADAAQRFGLEPGRVYMTGMSNGSMMAERYAAARPDRIKAVAGVSGTLDPRFAVTGPVPMLHVHGTLDEHVPYDGGRGRATRTERVSFAPVDETVAAFVAAAGVPLVPLQGVIDPADDGMRVIRTDWRRADGVTMVRLLKIEGGGHVWPGGNRAARMGGTRDITANDEILRFFAEHP